MPRRRFCPRSLIFGRSLPRLRSPLAVRPNATASPRISVKTIFANESPAIGGPPPIPPPEAVIEIPDGLATLESRYNCAHMQRIQLIGVFASASVLLAALAYA